MYCGRFYKPEFSVIRPVDKVCGAYLASDDVCLESFRETAMFRGFQLGGDLALWKVDESGQLDISESFVTCPLEILHVP
jgi:hypothetical protein